MNNSVSGEMSQIGSTCAGGVLHPPVSTSHEKHCPTPKKIGFLLSLLLGGHSGNAHTGNASMPGWMNG